ncbi:lipoate--protein ligase [Phytohalomonas tamaricis]|uniref:lipoate--protein ligase n=1 Tax=Phytohalomonas tamaricis TaxID=2081032 RepID=UPI000D0BDB35|nr:lipoate--protein ligase [Phytohalomonas tamaricis]
MIYIDNGDNLDQAVNFAMEEYVLREMDPAHTYLMLYRMHPTVIVGKHQNTVEEINADFVAAHNVDVLRRLSGGGTVYNDEGNLSFSVITADDGDSFNNYARFTRPVVDALRALGVKAELNGRNDITVNGKKISGNAQYVTRGRLYTHGTLMFDVNLDNVARALNVDPEKYLSKGIKSVRARVTNIREHLHEDIDIHTFRQRILAAIGAEQPLTVYTPNAADWQRIRELEKRYRHWEWTYGRSPRFNVQQKKRFAAGTVDARLLVEHGVISEAKLYGDFFGVGDISDIERRLIGVRYDRQALAALLTEIDIAHYVGNIARDELLSVLY